MQGHQAAREPPGRGPPPKKSVPGTKVGEMEGHWEMTRNPDIPHRHQFGGWHPNLTTWCAQDSKIKDDRPPPPSQPLRIKSQHNPQSEIQAGRAMECGRKFTPFPQL